MASIDVLADSATSNPVAEDAGFWKRAFALLIDAVIVGTVVPILVLTLAAVVPSVGNVVTLDTPFGLGIVERTIADKSTETTDASGTKITKIEKTIERSVLNRWVYHYRIEGHSEEFTKDNFVASYRTNWRWQVDPVTGEPMYAVDADDIALAVLILYWIFADASRQQGSFGKRLLGLRVVGPHGERLTLAQSAGRNLLKIVSALPLLIGFMIAGWTKRKQALHDKLVGTFVIVGR